MIKKKRLDNINDIKISLQASDTLKEFKDTVYWDALKELMKAYNNFMKDKAFKLLEEDPNLAIKHVRYTAPVHALHFLIDFIEGNPRRESEVEE